MVSALKWASGIALLAAVLWRVDWREFAATCAGARMGWLAPLAAAVVLDRFWMAAKWRYLLAGLGVRVPLAEAVLQYLAGGLVGLATQWQLSADLARALGLGRKLGQHRLVAASVVFEKIVGAAALSALSIVSLALLTARLDPGPWRAPLVLAVTLAAALSGLPLLALSARATGPLSTLAGRLPGKRVRDGAAALVRTFEELRGLGAAGWVFFLLTLGEQLMPLVGLWFLKEAFRLPLSWVEILAVMPLIQLFSRLPISVEALGVREGLYVWLLGLVGWSAAESFAVALAGRVVTTVVFAAGGLAAVAIAGRERRRAIAKVEVNG
jgi:glycosyltransferase 2 family protein